MSSEVPIKDQSGKVFLLSYSEPLPTLVVFLGVFTGCLKSYTAEIANEDMFYL